MNTNHSNDYSYLDTVRINDGINACQDVFVQTYRKSEQKAVALLNDRRLTFPCLFILMPQVALFHLYSSLNSRPQIALGITNQILNKSNNGTDYLSVKNKTAYSVLHWMLKTGNAEDGLSEDYEEVMEVTISVLLSLYQDKSILPLVADMLFKRHRKGHYIHDLVWAFFQIHEPEALKIIAKYILSPEPKDVELACNLLHIGKPAAADYQKQYDGYLMWLKENDPFLYFTGESFQYASKPELCQVDLERKYMDKGTSSYKRQPVTPSNESENQYLQVFKTLTDEEKTALSAYSYKVRSKDVSEWKKWMKSSIDEQIKAAKTELGGYTWL